MIEFDVDMSYLLECDELDKVVLNDENGEHEPMEFVPKLGSGTCEQVLTDCDDGLMPPFTAHCSACGAEWSFAPKYCHNCGAKVTGTRDERKAVLPRLK